MSASDRKWWTSSLTNPDKTFPLKDIRSQLQSPLFGILPPEIRRMVFTFALTDYERFILSKDGKMRLYFHHRIHGHTRRTDTELLRTCKRVFQETWFMPFSLAKHGIVDPFFYYDLGKEPQVNFTGEDIVFYLWGVKRFAKSRIGKFLPRIDEFQLFLGENELYEALVLELYPEPIDRMVDLQKYRPRAVTITIDYVKGSPKFIEANWVNKVKFSPSVKIIEMEFRAERINKYILNNIAEFVAEKWFFSRDDGMVFKPFTLERSLKHLARSADEEKECSYWEFPPWGNSYSILINTVTWKPTPEFNPFTEGYECPDLDFEDHVFPPIFTEPPFGIQVLSST